MTRSATWQPALQLNEQFYRQVVAPLVGHRSHSAALLGWGSDVLGYDTEQSADHGWGPRLQIFVSDDCSGRETSALCAMLDAELPQLFHGWPVRYGWDAVPVQHHVTVTRLGGWLVSTLGLDPRKPLTVEDWLGIPQQRLLGVTRGAVYHDDAGDLAAVRESLAWYPRDVWLWLLGSQWARLAEEEAFVGRASQVGDDLGSRIVAARQVREVMRLALLLDRQYCPYTKWLGSEFSRLSDPDALGASLAAALAAPDHETRERALTTAYLLVARRHNASGLTGGVEPEITHYYGRPFKVLMAGRFAVDCLASVEDEALRRLPLVGSVDQFVDSTPVLEQPDLVARLRHMYTG